jgi:HK97 family phage prohead protease
MSTQNTQNTPIQPENIEKRAYAGGLEIRAAENEQNSRTVKGYAALYNTRTKIRSKYGDEFYEEIAPGAFDSAIKRSDIKMCWNHNIDIVLGRYRRSASDTLKIYTDSKGLAFELTMPESRQYELESVKRTDVDECSFMFDLPTDGLGEVISKASDGLAVRTITDFNNVYELSMVPFPAYKGTSATVSERFARSIHEAEAKAPEIPEIQEPDQNDINLRLMVAEIDF